MENQPATIGTDRDLAEAVIRHGSEAAFRDLYCRHTPRLLGFVTRLLARSDAEAEDVVQETWIRVCTGLGNFRWQSAFSTWLTGIGLNVVRDTLRRSARCRETALDGLPEPAVRPIRRDEGIDLERCIRMLPDDRRMVLVLHDVEGWKHAEISRRMEIPEGTSKSHLAKARKQLRILLSGHKETGHE
jgi:RNA polymerase sigma-70 factor (ECF subfamily)